MGTLAAMVRVADVDTVAADVRFPDMFKRLVALPPGRDLYVLGDDGRYLGTIALDALRGHFPDDAFIEVLVASDVVSAGIAPVSPSLPPADLAGRFAALPRERLPVVDPATGRLLGAVARGR